MSDLKRCLLCKGTKKVMGLGLIPRDCTACGGIGYVNAEPIIKRRKKQEEQQENSANITG
jgi:hypothetical protein